VLGLGYHACGACGTVHAAPTAPDRCGRCGEEPLREIATDDRSEAAYFAPPGWADGD
jgi:hypothetical protein